jgi:hypothetical protein
MVLFIDNFVHNTDKNNYTEHLQKVPIVYNKTIKIVVDFTNNLIQDSVSDDTCFPD